MYNAIIDRFRKRKPDLNLPPPNPIYTTEPRYPTSWSPTDMSPPMNYRPWDRPQLDTSFTFSPNVPMGQPPMQPPEMAAPTGAPPMTPPEGEDALRQEAEELEQMERETAEMEEQHRQFDLQKETEEFERQGKLQKARNALSKAKKEALEYEGWKEKPVTERLKGVQPSEMAPMELDEYADAIQERRTRERLERFRQQADELWPDAPISSDYIPPDRPPDKGDIISRYKSRYGEPPPEGWWTEEREPYIEGEEAPPTRAELLESGITGYEERRFGRREKEMGIAGVITGRRETELARITAKAEEVRERRRLLEPPTEREQFEQIERLATQPPAMYGPPMTAGEEDVFAPGTVTQRGPRGRVNVLERPEGPEEEKYTEDFNLSIRAAIKMLREKPESREKIYQDLISLFPEYGVEIRRLFSTPKTPDELMNIINQLVAGGI